jgi:KDO2-lipid IV(A) lauroyltransferase
MIAHAIEATSVRAGFRLLSAIGPVRASNLAGSVMRTIGPLLPLCRVADANLRHAFPELNKAERRRIIRGVWENLGRTFGELPHLSQLCRTAKGPGWEIVGEDIVRAQAIQGGPAIFFSGHIGNWEVAPMVAAALGLPASPMFRAASNPVVDRIILDLRRRAIGNVPMFAKGASGARAALAHLSRGGCLGFLMDQKQNDGIAVDFFGRPAMTAPGLASLALRFRCPVIPFHAERIGPARLRVICEAPLVLPNTSDRHADIAALTQQVNATLERWIRAQPDSWLWLHRRWPKDTAARG